MKLRITDKAKEDLAEIDGYTRENWGNHQADTYMAELENRFVSLLGTPYLGSSRPEVSQGYRCLLLGGQPLWPTSVAHLCSKPTYPTIVANLCSQPL